MSTRDYPSFVKFELGLSCLTSRASLFWRPKKSIRPSVRPSVRYPQNKNFLTKSKIGQKTPKKGDVVFDRPSFDSFFRLCPCITFWPIVVNYFIPVPMHIFRGNFIDIPAPSLENER